MSNINKQALLESIPFTTQWKQQGLATKSDSYRSVLEILKTLNTAILNTIKVQREHLKFIKSYGVKFDLYNFAKHVDGFLRNQEKIIILATNKEYKKQFEKLLEQIESELTGSGNFSDFDFSGMLDTVDDLLSASNTVDNPPSTDWKATARKASRARNQRRAQRIQDLIKEGGIQDWFGARYYKELKRGQKLKNAINQIINLTNSIFEKNKMESKMLKASFAKGDPDEYFEHLKILAGFTGNTTAKILQLWNEHFKKFERQIQEDNFETPTAEPISENTITETENTMTETEETATTPEQETLAPTRTLIDDSSTSPRSPRTIVEQEEEVEEGEEGEEGEEVESEEEPFHQTAEIIISKMYKAASLGNSYLTAKYILDLADEMDKLGDSQLAHKLTKIAEEAFDE